MTDDAGPSAVTFGSVRALFRERDRASMRDWFDLWDYSDVRERADVILERLEEKSMPCDKPWTADMISVFKDWIESGMPE